MQRVFRSDIYVAVHFDPPVHDNIRYSYVNKACILCMLSEASNNYPTKLGISCTYTNSTKQAVYILMEGVWIGECYKVSLMNHTVFP